MVFARDIRGRTKQSKKRGAESEEVGKLRIIRKFFNKIAIVKNIL